MRRRLGVVGGLFLLVALWYGPVEALAQGRPVFGPLDAGGMPSALTELKQNGESAGFVLNAGTPYFVWAAKKVVGVAFNNAAWRRYGPFTLGSGRHYSFIWEGEVWGGNVANNDLGAARGSILSPALAALGFENKTDEPALFIINPLPPGSGGDTGAGTSPFDGVWHTTRQHKGCCSYSASDNVSFTTDASGVTSSSGSFMGTARGTVSGTTLNIAWGTGQATFVLSADGKSLTGTFSSKDGHRGTIRGNR